ncbi:hypothetical protein Ancab_016199, partial [Ancistrocladus abbreviatus]
VNLVAPARLVAMEWVIMVLILHMSLEILGCGSSETTKPQGFRPMRVAWVRILGWSPKLGS